MARYNRIIVAGKVTTWTNMFRPWYPPFRPQPQNAAKRRKDYAAGARELLILLPGSATVANPGFAEISALATLKAD